MSANPIANAGQFTAEAEVRAMLEEPATKAARAHVAQLWRVGHGIDVPAEVEPEFDAAMDGWVANYLFKAAAADPIEPRFVRNFMPAYHWAGGDVPDARMGGDNPDNCYRLAGIRHGCAYRVSGRMHAGCPAHVSFTLVENWGTSLTVQTVELPGILVDADGHFTITIDDTPAAGRVNHLTTNIRVKFLFVRDSMMGWAAETPLLLGIERIGGPDAQPQSAEERLADALRRVREDVPLYYWFFRLSAGRPVNQFAPPMRTASVGGLVGQATAIARLRLDDDEAAIVRFDPAGARYNSIQLAMWWYRSIDAHRRQSGLTAKQATPDTDGRITAVMSSRDPEVANWIDTGGYRDLLPMVRWQGLDDAGAPALDMTIVPFEAVDAHVGDGMVRIDSIGRAAQLASRRAAWARRTTV